MYVYVCVQKERSILSLPTGRYGNSINSPTSCIIMALCVYVDDLSVGPTSRGRNVIPTGCILLFVEHVGDRAMCLFVSLH